MKKILIYTLASFIAISLANCTDNFEEINTNPNGISVNGAGFINSSRITLTTGRPTIDQQGTTWTLKREKGNESYESSDPDTGRIWWHDTGVHQNATFCVQPDPISGMQCWHQRVRVTPAAAGDEYGDVVVDTAKSREAYL